MQREDWSNSLSKTICTDEIMSWSPLDIVPRLYQLTQCTNKIRRWEGLDCDRRSMKVFALEMEFAWTFAQKFSKWEMIN